MITRHRCGAIEWIDLESPTEEELESIMSEFAIAHQIHEEIMTPTPYPLVVTEPDYVYMILHFPTATTGTGPKNQEIDFIVGKKFLITVRYEVIDPIYTLHKSLEAKELLRDTKNPEPYLLEQLFRRLYRATREETEGIARTLERIERDIFSGKEQVAVRTISEQARVLLRFETTLGRHTEALFAFLTELKNPRFLGKEFGVSAAHIEAERSHVASLVGSLRAVSGELRTTNDSLLSASQNHAIKMFTLIAFCTFPLTLIAAIFAMETEYKLPFIGEPYDFWVIIGIMVAVDAAFLIFFKLKRWI
jgi:magnesium transporter